MEEDTFGFEVLNYNGIFPLIQLIAEGLQIIGIELMLIAKSYAIISRLH